MLLELEARASVPKLGCAWHSALLRLLNVLLAEGTEHHPRARVLRVERFRSKELSGNAVGQSWDIQGTGDSTLKMLNPPTEAGRRKRTARRNDKEVEKKGEGVESTGRLATAVVPATGNRPG